MKNQRATEIKVGITVLLGLIVFIWLLGWTKNFTFTTSDNQLQVKFNNISGLEIGNNVTVNGVKKGHVSDFYLKESEVIVTISVDSDIKLNKDAAFFLESTDLMGGRKIEIYPGKSQQPLDYDAIHQGTYITDIAGVIALFGEIQDKISIIATETAIAMKGMNSFLGDESFVQELKSSISNLNRAAIKMEQVVRENEKNIKEISENTKEITSETKMFFQENKNTIQSTINNLNAVVLKSDSLITSLNALTQQTISGENNLGKILFSDSLYNNILESMEFVKKLSKILIYQLQTDGIPIDANIF